MLVLPDELIDQVVEETLLLLPPYLHQRQLGLLSLVSRRLVYPAQSRLFSHPVIHDQSELSLLSKIVSTEPRLAAYVKGLGIQSLTGAYFDYEMPVTQLEAIGRDCKRFERLEVICSPSPDGDRFSLSSLNIPTLARRVKSLCLSNVHLNAQSFFPSITHLDLHNVSTCSSIPTSHLEDAPPLHFPALISLSLNYDIQFRASPAWSATASSLLSLLDFSSTSSHLESLSLGRSETLYSIVSSPATSSSSSSSSRASPTPPLEPSPSLTNFSSLHTLSLLAESSYKAKTFFPLLDTITSPNSLKSLIIWTDIGYRDKVQEVEGMAGELIERFESSLLKGVERLRLCRKTFGSLKEIGVMQRLLELMEERAV